MPNYIRPWCRTRGTGRHDKRRMRPSPTIRRARAFQPFSKSRRAASIRIRTVFFFGGTGPSRSRRTIEGFARTHMSEVKRIAVVDFHTGLGPRGYGEIIGRGAPGDPQYERTVAWYGPDVKSAAVGNLPPCGSTAQSTADIAGACPQAEQTAITLEFGTLPLEEVHEQPSADNQLYAKGGAAASPHFKPIKAQMRAAFYGEDSQWKKDIWARGQEIVEQALAGVGS